MTSSIFESTFVGPLKYVIKQCRWMKEWKKYPNELAYFEKVQHGLSIVTSSLKQDGVELSEYPLSHSLQSLVYLHHMEVINNLERMDKSAHGIFVGIEAHVAQHPELITALQSIELLLRRNFGEQVYFLNSFSEIEDRRMWQRNKIVRAVSGMEFYLG